MIPTFDCNFTKNSEAVGEASSLSSFSKLFLTGLFTIETKKKTTVKAKNSKTKTQSSVSSTSDENLSSTSTTTSNNIIFAKSETSLEDLLKS